MTLSELLSLPTDQLLRRARVGCKLFPDVTAMMEYFARTMADEIKLNNEQARPTRWILPVGPVDQYFRLVEISNRERISWKNVLAFQMDDFLDWQGRPLPVDHPLSFEGFMRQKVFNQLDSGLRPLAENVHFPSPNRTWTPSAIN